MMIGEGARFFNRLSPREDPFLFALYVDIDVLIDDLDAGRVL